MVSETIEEYLEFKAARRAMKDARWRFIKGRAEIFYKGRWRKLGITDECDDVRTTIAETSDKEYYANPVAYLRKAIMLGARVTNTGFFVIDAGTDG